MLCAPYKQAEPSGTMTSQTGLIPVTVLTPIPSLLSPHFGEPFLPCKIFKVISESPHDRAINSYLTNNANMAACAFFSFEIMCD